MHMPPPVHGASMVGKYIHDSELINGRFECHYVNLATAKNLEDVNKFRWGKVRDVLMLIRCIKDMVRTVKPDLVYFTPNATGLPFYKEWIIVKTLQTSLHREASRRADGKLGKIVVHYHNKGVSTRQDRWIDNWLYERFFKDLKVILLAENLYEDVEKYVARENVMICPNGIPDVFRDENEDENLTENPDDNPVSESLPIKGETEGISLLFLSNMLEEKGVWTLLEACRELKRRGVPFHCDFVGGWKDVRETDFNLKIIGYGMEDCVTAHGPKYGADKLSFFEKADVMVFPTYYHNECFPLVLLEGMMHGLPCISTDEGGIPAIIEDGETGYIVKAKDSQLLASKIENLANDRPKCQNMGVAGRKRFLNNFTQEIFENRITEILKQLV